MSNNDRKGTQILQRSNNFDGYESNVVNQLTTIPTISQGSHIKHRERQGASPRVYSKPTTHDPNGDTVGSKKKKMVINIDIPVDKSLRKNLDIKIHQKMRIDNANYDKELNSLLQETDNSNRIVSSANEQHKQTLHSAREYDLNDKRVGHGENKWGASITRDNMQGDTHALNASSFKSSLEKSYARKDKPAVYKDNVKSEINQRPLESHRTRDERKSSADKSNDMFVSNRVSSPVQHKTLREEIRNDRSIKSFNESKHESKSEPRINPTAQNVSSQNHPDFKHANDLSQRKPNETRAKNSDTIRKNESSPSGAKIRTPASNNQFKPNEYEISESRVSGDGSQDAKGKRLRTWKVQKGELKRQTIKTNDASNSKPNSSGENHNKTHKYVTENKSAKSYKSNRTNERVEKATNADTLQKQRQVTSRHQTLKQIMKTKNKKYETLAHNTDDSNETKSNAPKSFEKHPPSKESKKSSIIMQADRTKERVENKSTKLRQNSGSSFELSLTCVNSNSMPRTQTPKQFQKLTGKEEEPSDLHTNDKDGMITKHVAPAESPFSIRESSKTPQSQQTIDLKDLDENKSNETLKHSNIKTSSLQKKDGEYLKTENTQSKPCTPVDGANKPRKQNISISETPAIQPNVTAVIETFAESEQNSAAIEKDTKQTQDVYPTKDNASPKHQSRAENVGDENTEEINIRPGYTSPSKTAFSRHHTKASFVKDKLPTEEFEKTSNGATRSKNNTPIVPPLAITSSIDTEDMNHSIQSRSSRSERDSLVKSKLESNENKDTYCKFCAMSFKNKIQLEYHKAKFCISMSDTDDITSIREARDYFTVGSSGVIHSTPRVWAVAGKLSSIRRIEDVDVEENETFQPLVKYYWDKCFNGRVTECAVNLGFDKVANCFVYVCRAKINEELIPGKVVPSRQCAYVSTAGEQVSVTDYEVLTDPHDLLSWKHADIAGGIPRGALKAGHDKHELVYFVARTSAPDGSVCCGKYVPQDLKCYFPWDGSEHSTEKFDFLCKT